MDDNVVRMGSKGSKIADIAAENGTSGLGYGHYHSIDRRSLSCRSPNRCSPSHQFLGKLVDDVADLQEPVNKQVSSLTAAQAFDQHH